MSNAQGFNPLFVALDPKTKIWTVAGLADNFKKKMVFVGFERHALPRAEDGNIIFPGDITPKDLDGFAADPSVWPAGVVVYRLAFLERVNFSEDGRAHYADGDELTRQSIADLVIEYDPETDTVSVDVKPKPEPAICV